MSTLGEGACLSFSTAGWSDEIDSANLNLNVCHNDEIPEALLSAFIEIGRQKLIPGTTNWHHLLWEQFRAESASEYPDGAPGLDDLYATVEVFRRLAPAMDSRTAANLIFDLCVFADGPKFKLRGERPDPAYDGTDLNHLTLHSSKGLEFRSVWLTGCDYSYSVRERDETAGQPNVQDELFEWGALQAGQLLGQTPQRNIRDANRRATKLENRRLLYVGMSRAADLLIVSVTRPVTLAEFGLFLPQRSILKTRMRRSVR